jgi:hypothetical protein
LEKEDAEMAELIIYVDENYGGLHTHTFQSVEDFTQLSLGGVGTNISGNWNDLMSSFVVVSGQWTFFRDINFQSQQGGVFGNGAYPFVEFNGIDNDTVSSVRLVGE